MRRRPGHIAGMGAKRRVSSIESDDIRASEELLRVLGPVKRIGGKPVYSEYQRRLLQDRAETRRMTFSLARGQ